VPLVEPTAPEPAKVLTTPPGVILRIRWLKISAIYRLPAASKTPPEGWLKLAAVPVPLAAPIAPEPAKVLTIPWPEDTGPPLLLGVRLTGTPTTRPERPG